MGPYLSAPEGCCVDGVFEAMLVSVADDTPVAPAAADVASIAVAADVEVAPFTTDVDFSCGDTEVEEDEEGDDDAEEDVDVEGVTAGMLDIRGLSLPLDWGKEIFLGGRACAVLEVLVGLSPSCP